MRASLTSRTSLVARRWALLWTRLTGVELSAAEAGWLALVPGLLLVVPAIGPQPDVLVLGLPAAAVVLLLARRRAGYGTIALLVAVGTFLRVAWLGRGSSDVLVVTQAAIGRVPAGLDPWGVGYAVSSPAGAPFPYGPLELVWYMPWRNDPRWVEFVVSMLILAALAVRGRSLGLAVYALAPVLALSASDGSNDTSAGLLLLFALLAARRSAPIGAVLLAAAAAFKLYALAWLPALAIWAGAPAVLAFAAASLVFWGPSLLAFGPAPMLESLVRAQSLHTAGFGIPARLTELALGSATARAIFGALQVVLGCATALLGLRAAHSWAGVLAAGLATYLVVLYAGYWASLDYLAAVTPILCWELDDLAGFGPRRASLPGDPVGRLEAWLDRRWPIRPVAIV